MYKILRELKTAKYGKRFSVTSYEIELPNKKTTTFYLRKSAPFSIIIPFLDEKTVILIRQYRFGINKVILEFPMGVVDGKKPKDTAVQELEEETGYKAKSLILIKSFYLSPGWSTQIGHIYVAKGLIPGMQKPEPYEFIEVVPTKLSEIGSLIRKNVIIDASSTLAYYSYMDLCGESALKMR